MPATVQIVLALVVAKITALPDAPPVAFNVAAAAPNITGDAGAKPVMVWVALMLSVNAVVEDPLLVSVTVTEKLALPAALGVPEITPAALKLNPAGNVPNVTANVGAPTPPLAVIVWLYAAPTVPASNGDAVEIVGRGIHTIGNTRGAPIWFALMLIEVPSIASTANSET